MIALLLSALAQDEACAPTAADAFPAALADAEAALSAIDLDRSRAALDRAREASRCSPVPVAPADLGRYAWANAEVASAEMDAEIAWQWIRLAREVGATELPARIGAEHALRVVLAEEPDAPPISGPTGVRLNIPKKGAIYADGKVITRPELSLSTPHLVQVFDREALYLGAWQLGASFPVSVLVAEVTEGRRDRAAEIGVELPPANWKPKKLGTEAAYKDWIKKHPKGPWLQEAKDGLDDLAWAKAVEIGSELAAKQYLHDWPDGLHVDDARFAIEHLAYARVMATPSRQAWQAFLAETPDGSYATEARLQLDMLDWKDARAGNDSASYLKYLEARPQGRYAARAAELAEERAIDEARAKGTDAAIERFLERFPDGRFADEARAMLGGVQFQSVTLEVAGPADEAVRAAIHAALKTEVERRKIPVLDATAADGARFVVQARVHLKGPVTEIGADLSVWFGELERPLFTLAIQSTMLPTEDAGARLAELIVANLRPFDRWRPVPDPPPLPKPEDAKDAKTAPKPAPGGVRKR